MAQAHKLRKARSLFSSTLSTGIGTGTGDTITPNSVTGLPTDTEITLTFDRIDAAGTATPTKMERITGTISGGNLINYTRAVEGTEQAHSSGAVIEYIWNGDDWNDHVDAHLAIQAQDGNLKSGLQINDTSSDHQYILGVSELTADRTITLPLLTGNDDFVFEDHIQTLTNKTLTAPVLGGTVTGTYTLGGTPTFQGIIDGWIGSTDTWTYASASTFTISGVDRTTTFTKGTRLKFTQTTVKYAVVVSSSFSTNTTVTIAVNNDYTIANAAITSPYYSYQANPQGYPGWFNYSPSYTGFSSSPPDPIRYYIIGTLITLETGGCGSGVSNATSYTISSPVTIATGYWTGFGGVYDNSSWQAMCGFLEATSSISTTVINARKNTYATNNWTASNNKAIYGQITYGF